MPDPGRRARQQAVYRDGLEAPIVHDAARTYDRFFRDLEDALANRPYLCGPDWSLADGAATPYVNRAKDLGLLPIWTGACPRVMDWFARIRARPSFEQAVTRYFTERDANNFAGVDKDAPDKVRAILQAA